MKNLKRALAVYGWDIVMVLGAAAVTAGAAMLSVPAGLIVGGMLSIAGAVLANAGGGDSV